MKTALITGITGQDGSYLTELLLKKGYTVYGVIRRSSSFNTERIDHIYQDPHDPNPKLRLVYGDLNDASSLNKIIRTVQPTEIYHLGAQSHVRVSFDIPEYTGEITGLGAVRILEAIRESGVSTRFYNASSSEMFGNAPAPQSEKTPFEPRSPYAAAKVYAHWMTVNYREGYKLFAVGHNLNLMLLAIRPGKAADKLAERFLRICPQQDRPLWGAAEPHQNNPAFLEMLARQRLDRCCCFGMHDVDVERRREPS